MELLLIALLIVWLASKNSSKRKTTKRRPKSKSINTFQGEPEWEWNETTKKWEPKDKSRIIQDPTVSREKTNQTEILDYGKAYQAKYLLSKNELAQYKVLKQIADAKGYVICPKVRLLDIVEPRRGIKKYMTYFYKIQAKHVDFTICDQSMHIRAIIELDDASHDTPDRIERDLLVDKILRSVGYKVIHTRYITYDILDTI